VMRFCFFLLFGLLVVLPAALVQGADITTLSGKKYLDVRDIAVRGDRLVFSTATEIVRIPLTDVPPALIERYKPKPTLPPVADAPAPPPDGAEVSPLSDQLEDTSTPRKTVISIATRCINQIAEDMKAVENSKPVTFTQENAYSADQIDAASKESLANGRAMAFFILEEKLFNQPADAKLPGSTGALAQLYQTLSRGTTVVFVVTPRDLAKLPPAVLEVLNTQAPVTSPRVVFTNAEASAPLFDLALLSESWTKEDREKAVIKAVQSLKRWYADIANSLE